MGKIRIFKQKFCIFINITTTLYPENANNFANNKNLLLENIQDRSIFFLCYRVTLNILLLIKLVAGSLIWLEP